MNFLSGLLLAFDAILFLAFSWFAVACYREREARAFRTGIAGAAITLFLAFCLTFPAMEMPVLIVLLPVLLFFVSLFIPAGRNSRALQGTRGHLVSDTRRFDERDSVFARNRSLTPGSDPYLQYYRMHPEREGPDAARRAKGFMGTPGSIDDGYRPNVAMMETAFAIPPILGRYAVNEPGADLPEVRMDAAGAARMVKNMALHFGADNVGICRVDPGWIYAHRGEIHYDPADWGREISDLPPYAVVFLTEMDIGPVSTAPHTPTVAESAHLYAKGAYISTLLAGWFARMGYRGHAEHSRHYDMALPPLAVDAGLGEIGRLGYLVAPGCGPRVRIFAVLTDMPLKEDRPVSIGVDAFCRTCRKCADSCPSRSIPAGDKTVCNGAEKWKLNEVSCYDYWGKVGTDCSVCMAVCPFSRPDTLLHRIVRWFVARSFTARRLFPFIDNWVYGKKWRPKPPPGWLDYRPDTGDRPFR